MRRRILILLSVTVLAFAAYGIADEVHPIDIVLTTTSDWTDASLTGASLVIHLVSYPRGGKGSFLYVHSRWIAPFFPWISTWDGVLPRARPLAASMASAFDA